jgi:hypothetical protein
VEANLVYFTVQDDVGHLLLGKDFEQAVDLWMRFLVKDCAGGANLVKQECNSCAVNTIVEVMLLAVVPIKVVDSVGLHNFCVTQTSDEFATPVFVLWLEFHFTRVRGNIDSSKVLLWSDFFPAF